MSENNKDNNDNNDNNNMFKNILVAYDLSVPSIIAFEHALKLAKEFHSLLHIVYVVETSHDPRVVQAMQTQWNEMITDGKIKIDELKEIALNSGIRCSSQVCRGFAHEVISKLGEQCQLIIMGAHSKTNMARFLLGSVTENVISDTKIPVIVIKISSDDVEEERKKMKEKQEKHHDDSLLYKNILVCFNDSPHSENALKQSLQMANASNSNVTLLHITTNRRNYLFFAEAEIEKANDLYFKHVKKLIPEACNNSKNNISILSVNTDLKEHDAICNISQGNLANMTVINQDKSQIKELDPFDLIIVGTHHRSIVSKVITGSVAESVFRNSSIPVMAIPFTPQTH